MAVSLRETGYIPGNYPWQQPEIPLPPVTIEELRRQSMALHNDAYGKGVYSYDLPLGNRGHQPNPFSVAVEAMVDNWGQRDKRRNDVGMWHLHDGTTLVATVKISSFHPKVTMRLAMDIDRSRQWTENVLNALSAGMRH